MRSYTSHRFREMYRDLPGAVQRQARRAYRLFLLNPSHPSLVFKKVDPVRNIYSAGVGLGYRALGELQGAEIVWFWIGRHREYEKML